MLHELEEANAFVVAVDVARTWFRYHHLLADLLRLELRREPPDERRELHRRGRRAGSPSTGTRSRRSATPQRGRDWELAARAARPPLGAPAARRRGADARRAARRAARGRDRRRRRAGHDRRRRPARRVALGRGRRAASPRRSAPSASCRRPPPPRRDRARHRRSCCAPAGSAISPTSSTRRRALAARRTARRPAPSSRRSRYEPRHRRGLDAAARGRGGHLERGLALGAPARRPYLEVGCLTALGTVANLTRRLAAAEELLREAIAIAERLGWSTLPLVGIADVNLAGADRPRAARRGRGVAGARRPDPRRGAEPAASVGLRHCRGMLAMARERLRRRARGVPGGGAARRRAARAALPRRRRAAVAAARAAPPRRVEPLRAALAEATNGRAVVQPAAHAASSRRRPRRAAAAWRRCSRRRRSRSTSTR